MSRSREFEPAGKIFRNANPLTGIRAIFLARRIGDLNHRVGALENFARPPRKIRPTGDPGIRDACAHLNRSPRPWCRFYSAGDMKSTRAAYGFTFTATFRFGEREKKGSPVRDTGEFHEFLRRYRRVDYRVPIPDRGGSVSSVRSLTTMKRGAAATQMRELFITNIRTIARDPVARGRVRSAGRPISRRVIS